MDRLQAGRRAWFGPWQSTLNNRIPLLDRFRRVTTSGRYIPEVDGLRFVAILGVFLYHLRGYLIAKSNVPWSAPPEDDRLARLTHYGNVGVPLFFVLSGFILGLPFAGHFLKGKEKVSLRAYFLRRLTRLEPPYLLSLTLFLIMYRVVNHTPWSVLVPGYISSAFYLHNLLGTAADTIQSVGWSLEIEVQFYLLAPLLANLFRIRRSALRRFLIVGLIVAMAVLQRRFIVPGSVLSETILNHVQYFLGGFLVTDLFLNGWTLPKSRWNQHVWDLIWIAVWFLVAGSFAYSSPTSFFTKDVHLMALPNLFPVLMLATFRSAWFRGLLSLPLVTGIGGMCYSIYLVHFQLISLFGKLTKDLPISHVFWQTLIIQSVMIGLPMLMLASIFYLLVEKPCMDKSWPSKLWQRLRRLFQPDIGKRSEAVSKS